MIGPSIHTNHIVFDKNIYIKRSDWTVVRQLKQFKHTMEEAKRKNPVIVFDADEVLMIPYTHPEMYYTQIPGLLEEVSRDHYVCVASKNPRAKLAIEAWKLDSIIDKFRCGAHHEWKTIYQESWRECLSKHIMINEMLMELGLPEDHPVKFYDDDKDNFREFAGIESVECHLIKASEGVTIEDIETDRSKFTGKYDTSSEEDDSDDELCEACRERRKRKREEEDDDDDEEIPVVKVVRTEEEGDETPKEKE